MARPFHIPSRGNRLWPIVIIGGLIGIFLLVCIDHKLAADFSAGKWRSLSTRVGLVVLLGMFLAWRITASGAMVRGSVRDLRNALLTALFAAIVFYPLCSATGYLTTSVRQVAQVVTKGQRSSVGKAIALLRSFPKTFEDHAAATFQLPKALIHFNALVKIYGLGISPNKNIAYGKNGFFFEGWGARQVEKGITENFDNIADYMGQIPFSSDELRQWKRILEERQYWLRDKGAEYIFVLAPTKAMVYPEYLPDDLQNIKKGVTRYAQLSGYLTAFANVRFVDLRPTLLEAKQRRSYPLLFYKTDFHWNFYGAFIAYQAIIDRVREVFPQFRLQHPSFSDFELSIDTKWAHHRFMDMVGLPVFMHKNEHYITMIPKPGGRYDAALDLPAHGIQDVYPPERTLDAQDGSSINVRLIRNPAAPMRSLMLLGDSFLEKCVYFFSADAQRVLNYRTVVEFPSHLLRYEQPDLVVQEILNMFILRPPPTNPPDFTAAYLKGKFHDSATVVYAGTTAGDFTETTSGKGKIWEAVLPSAALVAGEGEVQTGRITMQGSPSCAVTISLFGEGHAQIPLADGDVHVTENQIYFQLPSAGVAGVTLTEQGDTAGCVPNGIEIRTDRRSAKQQ